MLETTSILFSCPEYDQKEGIAYSTSSDISIDQFAGFGVHGDGSGAVDEAIGYDGLAVDAGEGLWCL